MTLVDTDMLAACGPKYGHLCISPVELELEDLMASNMSLTRALDFKPFCINLHQSMSGNLKSCTYLPAASVSRITDICERFYRKNSYLL